MIYIKQFREALYLNRRRNSNTLDLWDSIFSSCCVESIDLMMYPKALHPPQFTQKRGGIDLSIKHIFFYLFFARFFLYCYWPYGAWLLNFPFISTCHWVFNGSRELEYLFCVLFHYRSSFVGIFFSLQPLSLLNATGSTMWRGCVVVGIQCSIELVKGYFFFRSPSKYTGVLAYRHVFFSLF